MVNEGLSSFLDSMVSRIFGVVAVEYFKRYGGGMEHLANIVMKNHKPSVNNSYVQFQAWYDEAAVLASPQISNELTKYMCGPTSVACNTSSRPFMLFTNEAFVHDNKLENQSMKLVATRLPTDCPEAFVGCSAMDTVGYRRKRRLAEKTFAEAGASRDDVGVVELHNCFAASEYGGKYVVNPSGGLEAKSHPIGDTGLAMHFSMTMQVVVSPLRHPEFYHADGPDGRNRCGQGQVQVVLGRAIATRKVNEIVSHADQMAVVMGDLTSGTKTIMFWSVALSSRMRCLTVGGGHAVALHNGAGGPRIACEGERGGGELLTRDSEESGGGAVGRVKAKRAPCLLYCFSGVG
ncbi:hypothetical protein BJY52DRAFT_1419220 [Lactarius psammicola]|nr:hypothetical protein BJY52DRAFT_1419220 [Lactarius psammicola]